MSQGMKFSFAHYWLICSALSLGLLFVSYRVLQPIPLSDFGSQPGEASRFNLRGNSVVSSSRPPRPLGAGPPAYIIEEHHYALHYWKQALPPLVKEVGRPLALLHWDAHPDFAAPEDPGGATRLDSASDSWYGMSSNDEFIVAAGELGLIDRTIWIYPSWDARGPRHKQFGDNKILEVAGSGFDKDGKRCEAEKIGSFKNFSAGVKYLNKVREKMQSSVVATDDGDCTIDHVAVLLSLSEVHFNELVNHHFAELVDFLRGPLEPSTADKLPPLLVDIDEDYFAQYRGPDLVKVAVEDSVYDAMADLLEQLCPPKKVALEHFEGPLSDAFREMVSGVRHCLMRPGSKDCKAPTTIKETAVKRLRALSVVPCNERSLVDIVSDIHTTLSDASLTPSDLEMMKTYGICLSTGHRTHVGEQSPQKLKMCSDAGLGGSSADDTDVSPAVIGLAEEPSVVQGRMLDFENDFVGTYKQLLKKFTVPLATVCRSVRDGYTPKHQWQRIEKSVLRSLEKVDLVPVFTEDLLGGREGWSNWTGVVPDSQDLARR
eukprot:TRINITY_DN48260_c0_g1_i1.p1 TRINITY_DN48260_c0_g1~~TRINITY_DN48260_c0_g1_i1.p1  ORF type:complete len:544 (+),score=113.49 TRINITY_DN48260_c0_g1_i1:113-1744(+)